jgi:hypothetical protein
MKSNKKEESKENNKIEYSYVLIPVKTKKKKKLSPCNDINKYINKYNAKNDSYYNPNLIIYNDKYSKYICNSDIYIE